MGRRVGVVGKSSPTGARRDLWLGAGEEVGKACEQVGGVSGKRVGVDGRYSNASTKLW